jgi:hypothetical protein
MAFWKEGRHVFKRSIGSTRHDVWSTLCLNIIRGTEPAMLDK